MAAKLSDGEESGAGGGLRWPTDLFVGHRAR
jgi:hypothetical protein